jgi:membrane protein required for colicin V production
MNYIDLSFLTIIALVTIRGLFRGLITELMVLLAIILGFMTATLLHPQLQANLISLFPDIPAAGAKVIAFVLIFLAVNIFIRLFSKTLNKIATFTFLQPINKVAGAIFAFTKVTLMLSIILIVVEFIPGSGYFFDKMGRNESFTYQPVKKFGPFLYDIFFAGSDKSFKDIIPMDKLDLQSDPADILKRIK